MASPSPSPAPSPVQSLLTKSAAESPSSSPRHSGSVREGPQSSSYKTGLVSSKNGHRCSYGTVAQISNSASYVKSRVSVIKHILVEGDTLQGLALKYSVTVQDIERLNSIWSTDSMFSRTSVKIPLPNDLESPSRSPSLPRKHDNMSEKDSRDPLPDQLSRLSRDYDDDDRLSSDEEVRSKSDARRQITMSCTAECREDGVKTIMDIINCADVQLQVSRDFADKLAKRNAHLNFPVDAYNRTHENSDEITSSNNSTSEMENSLKSSKRRLHLKRVDLTPETREASRDELEEKLFEL